MRYSIVIHKDKTSGYGVTVPAWVLAIVDQVAVQEGNTRSGLLVRAALSYVERRSLEQ